MKKQLITSLIKVLYLSLFFTLIQVQNLMATELNDNDFNPIVSTKQWAQFVLKQVLSLPSLQALEKGKQVAQEQQIGSQQALYNPELGLSYKNKTETEYNLIVSQTIDWFDKRSANAALSQFDYDLVTLDSKIKTENKLADALFSYIEYSQSKKLLDVAKQQEKLLTKLSADLKLREDAGDIGAIDTQMAYLSLAQNLQQISLIEIRHRKAVADLDKTLNSHQINHQPKPLIWSNKIKESDVEQLINTNLSSQYAELLVKQSSSESKIKQLNKKANPTIGLGVGREGNENTLSLELSVPLYIRNNYSSQYRAALYKVSQSELNLIEQQRIVSTNISQALNNYRTLKKQLFNWQKLTANRLKNSQNILNKQWQSGDISTSDYLFSLKQRTDTLITNIDLVTEMYKAWVEWLLASSQVKQWLNKLSKEL